MMISAPALSVAGPSPGGGRSSGAGPNPWPRAEGAGVTRKTHPAEFLTQGRVPALPQQGQVLPRLPPHRREIPDVALQLEGRGVAPDFLVELREVVLGLLDAVD